MNWRPQKVPIWWPPRGIQAFWGPTNLGIRRVNPYSTWTGEGLTTDPRHKLVRQECLSKNQGGKREMLVICVHTWNPKAPGMTEEEFLPRREEWMKDLMAKNVPVKSMQAAINWEQGKAWCLWETDTIERLEGIAAQFPNIHTDIIPVKLAPQVM